MGICVEKLWETIEGFPNYCVSTEGEVLNQKRGVLLKPYKENSGYLQVTLSNKGLSKKK